jgi:hypothetical protein
MARRLPTRSIGMLLLALWLILWGIINLAGAHFSGEGIVLGILALAAGILILLGM